ncbi:MAG TPA: sugar phosphate isomerase/epimerase family protein [Bryobacteraceae bacterium]|nr:sugar phosphate isomerase/epimerase family protein [Bryobacteraceae bacterium]
MPISRRSLLLAAGVALPLHAKSYGFRLGVTDWNLKQTGKVDAVSLAGRLGFQGVEVSLGRTPVGGKLPLDNAGLQAQYLAAAKKHGIRLAGTCLDILHVNYLKNDKLGQKWVADAIPITRKLNARVMLLPFFGKGALRTKEEKDYVGDFLREIGPEAEKAAVLLGLENTISAEDNAAIMERSRSKAVLTYYDIGNSTLQGFDVVKEIRWLGHKRICQMHLKDNPHYLGEGKIDIPRVLQAMRDIGYEGFANLETSTPSNNVEADMKRNLTYLLKVLDARA